MNGNNYLNNGCATIEQRPTNYLAKSNYLAEFTSELDKLKARDNLGVSQLIRELKSIIDAATIEGGGVLFDTKPTEGHTLYVLSSDVIYKTLLKYVNKEELDKAINDLYLILQERINDLDLLLIDLDRGLYNAYETRISELELEFTSVIEQQGVPFSDKLGESNVVGITQKALTYFITLLYNKMADLNGEPVWGVELDAVPDYFISETRGTATIKVNSPTTISRLKIWANDELVVETSNVQSYNASIILTADETVIKMEANMLNLQFIKEMTITKYYPFFIGSGLMWEDAVTAENNRPNSDSLKGRYSLDILNDNDKIFIIIPKSRRSEVSAIELSGFQMLVDEATIDNKYTVFTSQDTYLSGRFLIEIA